MSAAHAAPRSTWGRAADAVWAAAAVTVETVGLFLYGLLLSWAYLVAVAAVVASIAPMWW